MLKKGLNSLRAKATDFVIDQVKGAVMNKAVSTYCNTIYDAFANKGNP